MTLAKTNWSSSVSIPKFDSSLGNLTSIYFLLTGYVAGSAAFESLDTAPTTVTMDLKATIDLQRPDSTIITTAIPVVNTSDNVTAYDDITDFGGTSGKTYSSLSGNTFYSHTSPPPSTDLGLFTGTGNIVLPVIATGSSTGSGAGNLVLLFQTYAGADVQVTYNYDTNTEVPLPATILLFAPGLFGLIGFRKKLAIG